MAKVAVTVNGGIAPLQRLKHNDTVL